MQFQSLISDLDDTAAATERLLEDVQAAIPSPDLLLLFVTADHMVNAVPMVKRLHESLAPQCMLGVSAEGVIGGEREIERAPGIALFAARLPGVRLHPFHVAKDEWAEVIADGDSVRKQLAFGDETRALIGFGDPFTTPVRQLLAALNEHVPSLPLIGGMASAARRPGDNLLVFNEHIVDEGFIGLTMHGGIDVQTVVSQGCRPIGEHMVVTRAKENRIEQLGGRPALEALHRTITAMAEPEQQLLRNGLFVGTAINEYRDRFGRGDFLVRNVIAVDQESGALAVTDYVRVGQTVQFHVRDAQTADEDLCVMLETQLMEAPPAAGGLLFSCNGRGMRMFSEPCHDIERAHKAMPRTPIAGFFAAGELGPVGGKNFIHGHTASFALFRPKK
jgi:small ligand-binding sensory domain FIST